MSHSYVGAPVAAHLVVIRCWKYSQYLHTTKGHILGRIHGRKCCQMPKCQIFPCSPGGRDRTHNLPACTHGSAQGAGGCVSLALSLWRQAPNSSLRLAPHWGCSHSGASGHSIRCPLSGRPENANHKTYLFIYFFEIFLQCNHCKRTVPYLFPLMLICLRCLTRLWIRVRVGLLRLSIGLVKPGQSAPLL